MAAATRGIFILGAKRTPFGAFGGSLKHLSATQLGVECSKAAINSVENLNVEEHVETCIFGNVIQSSSDAAYLARHIALHSGMAIKTPSLTVNRLCGSGFESVIQASEGILLDEWRVALTGGSENMSQAPLQVNGINVRWGTPLGAGLKLDDALWSGLSDSYIGLPMGITAENLAEKYNITREEADEFGYNSQHRWGNANKNGIFKNEIFGIEIKSKKGKVIMDTDEHPRGDIKLEKMAQLPSVFKKDGTVTAGNASGICDGASALVIGEESAISEYNLSSPLARIVSWHRVGCDPNIMGIGPVEAIKGALKKANLTLDDMDMIEINEAFAPQALACAKELGIDLNKLNINGGAIALGHPLGASGARILGHLAHQLSETGKKYAIGSACIGGGQGIAVVLENPNI